MMNCQLYLNGIKAPNTRFSHPKTLFVIVLYHFLIISNIDGNTVMAFNFVVVFV